MSDAVKFFNVLRDTVKSKIGRGQDETDENVIDIGTLKGVDLGKIYEGFRKAVGGDANTIPSDKQLIVGYPDIYAGIAKLKGADGGDQDGVPVPPISVGVTDKLLGVFYRHAASVAMGGFPTHNDAFVVHLNEAACVQLINNTRLYDHVKQESDVLVWDTRRVHSGDVTARVHTQAFAKLGFTDTEIHQGVSVAMTGIGGIDLGERTMVLLPNATSFASGTVGEAEMSLGGLRIKAYAGFTHFGISFPSQFVNKLVIHARGVAAVCAHIRTGKINKALGDLVNHPAVDDRIPTLNLSHVVAQDADCVRIPEGAPMYKVRWSGRSQTALAFHAAQFMNVGNVSVLLTQPVLFQLVTPTRRSSTVSYIAAVCGVYQEDTTTLASVYEIAHQTRMADFAAMNVRDDDRKTAEWALRVPHDIQSFYVHTMEGAMTTTYKAMAFGNFSRDGLTAAEMDVAMQQYHGIVGLSRL